MDKKKMIAIPLIAIMLSLTTAVAVAHWVDNLYVDGYVKTGTLCACWRDGSYGSAHGIGPDWTCDIGFKNSRLIVPQKDIASTTFLKVDCDTLQVNITNGYPCYYDHITVGIDNCGTIPWAILSVTFETPYDSITMYRSQYFTLDLDGVGDDDIEIFWGDLFGYQIDPGFYADVSFDIHLMNPIPQAQNMTFTITWEVVNWNEYQALLPS